MLESPIITMHHSRLFRPAASPASHNARLAHHGSKLRNRFCSFAPTYAKDFPGLVARSPARDCLRLDLDTMAAKAPGSHSEGVPVWHRRSARSCLMSNSKSCCGPHMLHGCPADAAGMFTKLERSGWGILCLDAASKSAACMKHLTMSRAFDAE